MCAFLTHRFVKYNLQAAEKAGLTETAFRKQSADWTKVRAETMCMHRRTSHTATHLAFALHHIHVSCLLTSGRAQAAMEVRESKANLLKVPSPSAKVAPAPTTQAVLGD